MECGFLKSQSLIYGQRKLLESVLLFILILISATTTTITAQADKCTDGRTDPDILYTILDEFGDEASILFWNGYLELSCESADVDFIVMFPGNILKIINGSKVEPNMAATVTTIRLTLEDAFRQGLLSPDSSSGLTFFCRCRKLDGTSGPDSDSAVVRFWENQYLFCDEKEHQYLPYPCSGKELCLMDNTGISGTIAPRCKSIDKGNCDLTISRRKVEYEAVCLSGANESESECKAAEAYAQATPELPMVEALVSGACTKFRNFWQGNYTLRHNIFILNNITFIPLDKGFCEQEGNITCHLGFKSDWKKKKMVHGNCSDGWTVSAGDISKKEKTKFYCIYSTKIDFKQFRWQLYLYYAKVDVIYDGLKAKCKWPKWAIGWTGGDEETYPVDKKCEIHNITFPYPLKQVGENFTLEYLDGPVIDLTTIAPPSRFTNGDSSTTSSSTGDDYDILTTIAPPSRFTNADSSTTSSSTAKPITTLSPTTSTPMDNESSTALSDETQKGGTGETAIEPEIRPKRRYSKSKKTALILQLVIGLVVVVVYSLLMRYAVKRRRKVLKKIDRLKGKQKKGDDKSAKKRWLEAQRKREERQMEQERVKKRQQGVRRRKLQPGGESEEEQEEKGKEMHRLETGGANGGKEEGKENIGKQRERKEEEKDEESEDKEEEKNEDSEESEESEGEGGGRDAS